MAIELRHLPLPVVTVDVTEREDRLYELTKRLMDITIAATLLLVLSPLLLLIALAVRATSSGPIVFAQQRSGRRRLCADGSLCETTFTFYKFRSMYHNNDDSAHRAFMKKLIEGQNERGKQVYKMEDDPRITPLGRFLRKTSLDELPQLWNVLRGDMSLVGPRPALPYEVALYNPWHKQRLDVLPGITGLWQVTGRSSVPFDEIIKLDLDYVERRSLWLDLKILMLTPFVVVSARGAA